MWTCGLGPVPPLLARPRPAMGVAHGPPQRQSPPQRGMSAVVSFQGRQTPRTTGQRGHRTAHVPKDVRISRNFGTNSPARIARHPSSPPQAPTHTARRRNWRGSASLWVGLLFQSRAVLGRCRKTHRVPPKGNPAGRKQTPQGLATCQVGALETQTRSLPKPPSAADYITPPPYSYWP